MLKKLLLLCAALLIAPTANAQTVDEIVKKGELVVAIDPTTAQQRFVRRVYDRIKC